MGIEIIGKLTQKNNGDFKLVDLENVDYDGTGKSAKQELEKKIEEAKNSSTPYDDTGIKTDINTIKTDLGTEELTTTAKNVKGAVNEVAAQYKDIANDVVLNTFDDCIYNRSALKNINNREFFSMVVLGDSIGAGTAATDNYGFIQRFTNASYYHQSFVKYTMEYFYYKEATGWTK